MEVKKLYIIVYICHRYRILKLTQMLNHFAINLLSFFFSIFLFPIVFPLLLIHSRKFLTFDKVAGFQPRKLYLFQIYNLEEVGI